MIRYEHGLVTPGFVNLHAHCIRGGLFRGIPDDLEMEPFIPKLVYNILLPLTSIAAKELSADELRAVTALGMIDLLKGGTTTLLDMWHHGQEIFFDVARDLGLRTVGAPFIMSASNSRLGPGRLSGVGLRQRRPRPAPEIDRALQGRATRAPTASRRSRSARTPPIPVCLNYCANAARPPTTSAASSPPTSPRRRRRSLF